MSDNKLTQTEVSLNPPSEKLVNIKINGIALQVPNGENIIESAKRLGIDVPYFCYHPRLSKGDAANCRMCLVDAATTAPDGSVRKMPKPQTACTLPAAEGMVIETDTDSVNKDRKGVLEFLLINHPLDCPICDRGGECPLQNNTLFYGPPTSRYIEEKRHFPKAYPLSDYVVFDRERCIHCARCTRFTEDISGDSQLGFLKRGADMEVGTYAQTAYQSKFSGNVIELCPVGALLSRTYRFKARPWDLLTQRSVCSQCSNGCNIKFDYRVSELQRVNARLNEDVNEEWTCDRGKFGHDFVSSPERLKTPMLKKDGKFVPIDWAEAYAIIAEKFKTAGTNVGGIGGARSTNEDNFAFQKLFRQVFKSNNLDSRIGRYQGPVNKPLFDRFGYRGMGNSIAELEKMKSILVLGSDLQDEQPIIFLRIRKACRFHGADIINAADHVVNDTTNVGDFSSVNLIYKPETEIALLNGIIKSMFDQNLLPTTDGLDLSGFQKRVSDCTIEKTFNETGVSKDDIERAAKLLSVSQMAIIAGKTVTENPAYVEIMKVLGNLAVVTGNSGNINVPGLECNTHGAADMGMLPDCEPGYKLKASPGMNTNEMLEAASLGKIQALWLHEVDIAENYHDAGLINRVSVNCPFIVATDMFLSKTAQLANLVLPVASVAEIDGTYTNCERRVQRIYKAFDLSPEIKPGWLVFTEVAAITGNSLPYFSSRDILKEIASVVPQYSSITPKNLGESGVRWNYSQE